MKKLLLTGGVQCLLVGGYHFILPYAWGWKEGTHILSPAIEWGVYAINFFFSFLLVSGGISTLLILYKKKTEEFAAGLLFLFLTLFWAANALYQTIIPFPMPANLITLKWVMIGLAYVTFFLFLIPTVRISINKNKTHE